MDDVAAQDGRRPAAMAVDEWRLRLELAACYRLFDFLGWTEMIFNHITLRVAGGEPGNPHYLINPFGLHYSEVDARNLVKIDRHGVRVDGSTHRVNPAGFVIHSAVHAARPDAHCVMHTHTTAGMAVAGKRHGLKYENFYAALLHGRVAYHDFEGVTTDASECPRLVASLGAADVLILRNHGLLALGSSVPECFDTLWTLQRACEVQVATDSQAGDNVPVSDAVLQATAARRKGMSFGDRRGQLMFDGILRRAGVRYADLV